MDFGQTSYVLIGLLLAAWTLAAIAAILAARKRQKKAEAGIRHARRLSRMIDESPALPLLVRADGRIEAPQRLANWLGLDRTPEYLSELDGGDKGLAPETLALLGDAVRQTQKTATAFRMVATPRGSSRSLAFRGHLADPQVSPGGSALVWVFDFSDSESELVQLREDASKARADYNALVSLIEAAPMPMWFREPDGKLRLVNIAYVKAVGGQGAEGVIGNGVELVEAVDGQSARDIAVAAAKAKQAATRTVSLTIEGQRRAFRVTDLPIGNEGIAGYAIDIEDHEELSRSMRALGDAQRSMLDQLSAGVAQFDAKKRLVFANQPFQRIFALTPADLVEQPEFERLLDIARERGRVPEVRDYPEWRREKSAWFLASDLQEEAWSLSGGTHLRMVALPSPDGGMHLVAEDRTEQLRLSAMRDTLLRTRTATFDSLFESIAVFAPDGRLQLWNRRFAEDWKLETEFVDTHPHIRELLEKIGGRLRTPAKTKAIGEVVRAATLDRKQTAGRAALSDGRTFEFAGVPLPDGNALLTVLDITDSQRAEEALRERAAALVEADAVKTRFLANMSYELRTPLTSIGGFAEMLDTGMGGELSENGREYVDAIIESVGRLGEQIESLLDLSQSEAGMLPLAEDALDPAAILNSLIEDRAGQFNDAGLTLDVQIEDGLPGLCGDERRLSRAIGHLIDNSIAATPEGGRILLQANPEKIKGVTHLRIVVSDNGKGMDPAEMARAMDGLPPSSGEGTARRQGIGLPLARQMIEAHGGTLKLITEPGQGTAAIVDLPAAQ
ncbi:MAG: PAS-domain containing protein [Sphingomonadaceae bacterium]